MERLRHSATNSLLTRRDVVVVSSVSCIYGLGTPQEYVDRMVQLSTGQQMDRDELLHRFVDMQYDRNDVAFERGTFRVRGDTVEIIPMYEELAIRIEFFGDEIDALYTLHPMTGEVIRAEDHIHIFPASHYVAGPERLSRAIGTIEVELAERLEELEAQNKLLEAQRLRMRTTHDLEMLRQVGSTNGIENYSRHLDGRDPGSAPNTLMDYFPEDFLLVIDESHVTVPQIGAMFEGDRSRKRTLVDFGFRLPSALDNRPLTFSEFTERTGQTVYLSATPGGLRAGQGPGRGRADHPAHRAHRPRGHRQARQGPDRRSARGDRQAGPARRARAGDHADQAHGRGPHRFPAGERGAGAVPALRRGHAAPHRTAALPATGEFDVLVGINLLREGLDLPEVSLVAILDADKEGFLRSRTSLIQTIGRAARNVSGQVHMYADRITDSMESAIEETNRRREKQIAYNTEHGIDPTPLRKRIADVTDMLAREDIDTDTLMATDYRSGKERVARDRARSNAVDAVSGRTVDLGDDPVASLTGMIDEMTAQMHQAAETLQFEQAARLRDEVQELKKELRAIQRSS